MPDMDMNENEVNQGVSIETLLQVIGLRDVEGFVRDQGIKKLQEQAAALASELSALKSKPVPVSPELEQLRKAGKAADERVLQMENQVHDVAIERDGFKAGKAEVVAELQTARDDNATLQIEVDALKERVMSLTMKSSPPSPPVVIVSKKAKKKK